LCGGADGSRVPLFHVRDLLGRAGCEHWAPLEEIVMEIDLEQALEASHGR
jgi:hypothetical protein